MREWWGGGEVARWGGSRDGVSVNHSSPNVQVSPPHYILVYRDIVGWILHNIINRSLENLLGGLWHLGLLPYFPVLTLKLKSQPPI